MSMITSFDPFFRDFERLASNLLSRRWGESLSTPSSMPADIYRHGDEFVVNLDLPGIDPDSVEVTVDNNVLSVSAQRSWQPDDGDTVVLAERPYGRFNRQLYLGDGLDTEHITASYDKGVLSVHIPVAEQARTRRIPIASGAAQSAITAGSTSVN